MLTIAAIILLICGVVHSYLGERYILIRLFKRDSIPHLFGGDEFTKGTLRFCWHLMSVALFGFAAILFNGAQDRAFTLYTISSVFLLSCLFSCVATKGKHLSWVAFLMVSILTYLAANGANVLQQ